MRHRWEFEMQEEDIAGLLVSCKFTLLLHLILLFSADNFILKVAHNV
jgi:hypothetical protein